MEGDGSREKHSSVSKMTAMPTKAYKAILLFLGQNSSEEAIKQGNLKPRIYPRSGCCSATVCDCDLHS